MVIQQDSDINFSISYSIYNIYPIYVLYISLFKSLTAEKSSPLVWNVLKKILDLEKKLSLDGALLELKKGVESCNCGELVIAWESRYSLC